MMKAGSATITCLEYGPYDNGHILIGLSNGVLVVYNSFDLTRMYQFALFSSNTSIRNITIDPTNLIFVSAGDKGEVKAVSLVKRTHEYVYLEVGNR